MHGNLIIISSPSGGGKGTLIKEILRTLPNIGYSISFTTRQPRVGEMNGREYFFVSQAEFAVLIENNELLEYAEVHGNFYGTSVKQVEREISGGRDVILEIDVQGAANILEKIPNAVSIFILPPSFEVLRARLIARATESDENLALRLQNSFFEISQYENFEYVVVNGELSAAVTHLQTIVLGERQKRTRQTGAIQGILDSFDTVEFTTVGETK